MPWARIEADLFRHEKVLQIDAKVRPLAVALYVGMICHSSEMLSNGRLDVRIAYSIATFLGTSRPRRALQELEKVHLIERSNDEIVIPDFLDFHKSREEVLGDRKRSTERKRRSRDQQKLDLVTPGQGGMSRSVSQGDKGRDSRAHDRGHTSHHREELSLATVVRSPAPDLTSNDLPFHLELLIADAGAENASADTIRREAEGLPEAVIARTREALRDRRPRPDVPAAYVVATLRKLRSGLERERVDPEPEL